MINRQLEDVILKQQNASNPLKSCWVFASAGSGKTKILINRLLRLLLSGVLPSKILCLTFTKAAAGEMHHRIQKDLSQWVSLDKQELIDRIYQMTGKKPSAEDIKKARSLFFEIIDNKDKIKITTIHSFCQSLLKIFPFEAKISPNFDILEENAKKILIKRSIELVFKKNSDRFCDENGIGKLFQENNKNDIEEAIEDLIKHKEDFELLQNNYHNIDDIVKQIYQNFDLIENDNFDAILNEFKEKCLNDDILLLQKALANSKAAKDNAAARQIEDFLANCDIYNFNIYKKVFFIKEDEIRKPSSLVLKDTSLNEIYQKQYQIIVEYNDKLNSLKICQDSSLLLRLANDILHQYKIIKQNKSLLDYEDLIVATNQILQNDDFSHWIKMKIDNIYDHILIDESQDTNLKQWNIINSLTEDFFSGIGASKNNRSLFVVGDEKQSIYSFQGAEADISNKIYNQYQNNSALIEKINLNNSFRSAVDVLKAVDLVFNNKNYGQAISKTSDYQSHNPIRNVKGYVEIWPKIDDSKKDEQFNYVENLLFMSQDQFLNDKERMARYIAIKIKSDFLSKKPLEGFDRSVNFGDYMILLRNKTNGFDKALIKAFKYFNIPFSSQSRVKFSESLAIQDFLSLAKFVTTDFDNLNLAALLKSPIFGLSDDDLLIIINYDKKGSILHNLKDIKSYKECFDILTYIKNLSQNNNCFDFYYQILNQDLFKEKYIDYYGFQIEELIDKFLNIVYGFCQDDFCDLQKLLEFIKEADPEISLKSCDEDSVKILTIHSAKGLQAPIVFIADCSFNSNKLKNTKEIISWINFKDHKLPIWCSKKSWQNKIIKNHLLDKEKKAKEEYLRLLYVAMTRAENELYIAGFGVDDDQKSWYQIIKNCLGEGYFNNKIYQDLESLSQKINNSTEVKKIKKIRNSKKKSLFFLNKRDEIAKEQLNQSNFDCNIGDNFNFSQIRGSIIHEIVNFIIKNVKSSDYWLQEKATMIIDKNLFLSQAQKKDINDKIKDFINSLFLQQIRNKEIKSEIEIVDNGKIYRIDLIIEDKKEILIIDYKTDKKVPKIAPSNYCNQLINYKKSLQKIYQNKVINCAIFWLEELKLHKI